MWQIVSGLMLAMHYTSSLDGAFSSCVVIVRDV